ncbi:octopine/nopaline transport system permease protein [Ochrobactrum sp. RC6B]|uniref:ABC transporter permease n=1 Tax=Brucella intermedia TaxID=94625 RepID=UPI000DDA583C|nr:MULTISPECIES: ABC transporter permease [Brucella/Ochrobactrum group]KAB2670127.1 ABC transporter permease [Ochrobactrum sp. LMG 5442]MBB3217397.1 octopine/nopaline transport system permease protein [Ochrobactrum sp. RC6B]
MSFLDLPFMFDSLVQLCRGIPLTLQLMALSVISGAVLATILGTMRLSGNLVLDLIARGYIFVLRGTPLLVQLYIIYYGLSQFPELRRSFLWPFLREPYWCAVLALALNTAAYSAEIIRGGVLSVATGQIEAARAYGMSGFTLVRRILAPQALRQMLPAYSNEVILMVKSTALASTITMMEVTGLAAKLISATYRPVEVFICAGAIYLLLNFAVTRIFKLLEYRLSAGQRQPVIVHAAGGNS